MTKHEKADRDGSPPSGMQRRLSAMRKWELKRLHEWGLVDVDWDAERYCPCCISERLARAELTLEEAEAPPPSGTRRR